MYFFIVYELNANTREHAIADLTKLLEDDRLHHNIAARLRFTQIAEAHELVEEGRIMGNVVLEIE